MLQIHAPAIFYDPRGTYDVIVFFLMRYFHSWNPKTNDEPYFVNNEISSQSCPIIDTSWPSRDSEIHIRYFDARMLAQARCVVIVRLSLRDVVVNCFISGNFYFSFVSTSLAYITIPNNKR